MFIQKKSNVLEDVYGNYSVEPANQTRFPCERKIWGDGSPTTILKAAAPFSFNLVHTCSKNDLSGSL